MARLLMCFKPRTRDEDSGSPVSRHPHLPTRGSDVLPTQSSDSGTSLEPRRVVTYVELLKRRNEPLGLVLKGGADCNQPVYVGQLHPGGAAEKSEALQVGDIIRGINGTATDRLNQNEANSLLSNSGNVINLEVEFEAPPGSDTDDGTEKKTALISLARGRNNSFGFSISGGRNENRPITVSNVMVGSVAYKNGILKAGDRILKINRRDVTTASQMEAISYLKASEDSCTLEIEYDITVHSGLSEYMGQLSVELLKPKGVSLGIDLCESGTPEGSPLIISRVKEAGIADRCGALHVGDRLLSVNKERLVDKSITDVKHMLKHCDLVVELEIIQAHNFPDIEGLGDPSSRVPYVPSLSSRLSAHDNRSVLSFSSMATTHVTSTHPETMIVRLTADDIGYGLSLQGGATERGIHPITIASIEDGGPAAKLGQLHLGDQILGIDGIKMEGYSLQEAMKLVQEADDVLEMEVMFEVQDSSPPTTGTFEVQMKKKMASLNLGITINSSRSRGDPIWISSLKKGGIAYRSGMLHPGDVLLAINGQSLESCNLREAANILMSAGETVNLKVGKESSPPASSPSSETIIYSVELHRNQQSLGITLKGDRDREGHPVVISKIKEDGVAYKTGTLRVGDRILAINGESLFNKTMPEAVSMLNTAGDVVNLKICKAASRKKAHTKSRSPTGRHRGGGLYMSHRESFGSSSGSSFVGSSYPGSRMPRYRPKHSFEPILGESASGCNTPDNISLVSSIPPYVSHLEGRGGARRLGSQTPFSEASVGAFSHAAGSGLGANNWRAPPSPMEDSGNRQMYLPSPLPSENGLPLTLQYMLRQHSFRGGGNRGRGGAKGAAVKRDSSTDDEMSLYEVEGRVASKCRRPSLPSPFPSSQQYSPQSLSREDGGGVMWNFKRSQKHPIPVGRVSPITPSETERLSQQGKAAEDEVQHKHKHHHFITPISPMKGPVPTNIVAPIGRDVNPMVQGATPVDESSNSVALSAAQGESVSSKIENSVTPAMNSLTPAMNSVAVNSTCEESHGISMAIVGGTSLEGEVKATANSLDLEREQGEGEVEEQQRREQSGDSRNSAEEEDQLVMFSADNTLSCPSGVDVLPVKRAGLSLPRNSTLQVTCVSTDAESSTSDSLSATRLCGDSAMTEAVNQVSPCHSIPNEDHEDRTGPLKERNTIEDQAPRLLAVEPDNKQLTLVQSDSRQEHTSTPPQLNPSLRHDTTEYLESGAGRERSPTPEQPDISSLRRDSTLNKLNSRTHYRPEVGFAENGDSAMSHLACSLRYESTSDRPNHSPQSPITTYHQSDSSSITKYSHDPSNCSPPPFPLQSYTPTKTSPHSSLRRRNRSGGSDTKHSKQTTRTDRSPSRKPSLSTPSSNPGNAAAASRPAQPLVPSLNDYKTTIHKADEFGRAMAALAESGSSDQDSDSEPHSKLSAIPLQEVAKVREKMRASPSTVMHRVVISKHSGEVSFGFSISDGQYDQGVYVKTVKPGGPSDRGGLLQYDKIVRVNDIVLLPEHKCVSVYPMLKKYENDLILMVRRQPSQLHKHNELASN